MPVFADPKYLHHAARDCMRRQSSPGADGVSWANYRQGLRERIEALSRALTTGSWRPGPVRPVVVTTYTGKPMTVLIPTVEDRIVQRALRTAVEPVLEAGAFAPWVSGFRPGRNRITAIRDVAAHLAAGFSYVADLDVAQVSAGSTAAEVTDWLARYVSDGTFLACFRTALTALPEPLAPGSGLAPLLINLRLSRVDALLGGMAVVRFADNYCVFTTSRPAARAAFERVTAALATAGLRPHPGKSQIRSSPNPEDLFLIAG